jgi:hypothetical protein
MSGIETEIWNVGDDLRCVARPSGSGWQVCVVRGHTVVKSDVFSDAAAALIAAEVWRCRLDGSAEDTLWTLESPGQ